MLPKHPLPGSVHLEWKRCGRTWCRCSRGHLHGPYFYRRWREDGRQRTEYVKRADLESTLLAIELRKAETVPVYQIKASLSGAVATTRRIKTHE
jgi:hypothetical protein